MREISPTLVQPRPSTSVEETHAVVVPILPPCQSSGLWGKPRGMRHTNQDVEAKHRATRNHTEATSERAHVGLFSLAHPEGWGPARR